MPLTDTHLILLSAASRRSDGLLDRPARLAGAALAKLAARLLSSGLVEAVPVHAAEPHWHVDDTGERGGLRITPAGLAAIAADEPVHIETQPEVLPLTNHTVTTCASRGEGTSEIELPAEPRQGVGRSAPRAGTKKALLINLLEQENGASIAAIGSATGWLPHTVRAALTQLRRNGYGVDRSKNEQGQTVYRLLTSGLAYLVMQHRGAA